MEITGQSKLFDILNEYPFLEEKIITIAPPFKNLRNPVLRRTVGMLATVEKVAEIGNMDVMELVNNLRREVGQPEIHAKTGSPVPILGAPLPGDPEWIRAEPKFIVDGTEMLRRGEVPVSRVNELLEGLSSNEFLLLLTDFEPLPILDAMRKQNRQGFHKTNPQDPTQHLTFIQ